MLKILPQRSFSVANSIVLVPAQDKFLTQCLSAFSHRASAQEQARRGLTSAVGGEEGRSEGGKECEEHQREISNFQGEEGKKR